MDITIRLDVLSDSDSDELRKYLDKYTKYLVYEEIADQTAKKHYQGIIRVDDEKSYQAAKQRFSTMFKTHKGGTKSMAKVRSKNYEIYISKDKNLFASKGYSQDEIKEIEEQSYKKGEQSVEQPKLTTFQKAFDYCMEHGINTSSDGWQICETLIDYYRVQVKCEPNDFQLKNMTKSIYTHMVYERAKKSGNKAIYDNFKSARAKQIIGCEWVHV